MKKSFCFIAVIFTVLAAMVYIFVCKRGEIKLAQPCKGLVCPYAEALVHEVNKIGGLDKEYTLYTANFEKGQKWPEIKTEHNILWLGSTQEYLPDLSGFEYILASTPLLKRFLSEDINLKDKVYYLPLFTDKKRLAKRDGKFIALIGNPPYGEEIVKEKALPYRLYKVSESERILAEMPAFSAVIALGTAVNEKSLDLAPVFYALAAQEVPLATWWGWKDSVEDTLNLFNDKITFYTGRSDLARFMDDVRQKPLPDEIAARVQAAIRLVNKEYSLQPNAQKLSYLLRYGTEPERKADEKSLNFDLPVAVGHTVSGDFWLASDLAQMMARNKWRPSMSFFNSFYKYPASVNILIRGMMPNKDDAVGDINILYLAYPQIGDIDKIEDKDAYYADVIRAVGEYDAVATASESMNKELAKRGVKSYYVPQFTNLERFYPDFQEALATDILFVGTNAYYRKAALIALKHQLPITIYGPGWRGAARAEFIDNRDLYKYYGSAKIVLNDSREEMLAFGVISNRVFDATACGALVITDYIPEIKDVFGNCVPTWKNEEELVALINYYLDPAHEAERLEKAKCAQKITLENFTAEKVAEEFQQIIEDVKRNKGL